MHISSSGNIYLGSEDSKEAITVQRKGGDNGKEGAKQLQAKFHPSKIFNIKY
jgi:hypothetical protein